MLIKVNKEMTKVIVIKNGIKKVFDLSVSYNLKPETPSHTISDISLGNEVAGILTVRNLPVGAFIGRTEKTLEADYDFIARKLYRGTVAEAEDFLKDFSDSEREIIVSKIFKIIK